MKEITVTELKARLDQSEDIVLIDVREPFEHDEFNIGGTLLPLGELMSRMDELDQYKDSEMVVYCRSGNRSGMAQHLLTAKGFNNVSNLVGGVMAWQAEFAE